MDDFTKKQKLTGFDHFSSEDHHLTHNGLPRLYLKYDSNAIREIKIREPSWFMSTPVSVVSVSQ